jgi:hypothetical protein
LIDPNKTVVEKVGSLVGLSQLGLETVARYVLPKLREFVAQIEGEMADFDLDSKQMRDLTYRQALNTAGFAVHADSVRMAATGLLPLSPYTGAGLGEMMDTFGEDLLPYVVDDSSILYL